MANLTFDDEFNTLNSGTWQPSYSWSPNGYVAGDSTSWLVNPGYGPTSNPDDNPYSVNNGVLSINLMPTPSDVPSSAVGGAPFLSGLLQTQNSFSQTYGYFDMRAELPSGPGLNSAFWLLPESGAWPPELDAEEVVSGSPTTLVNTAHTGADNSANPMWSNIPDSSQGYHDYAVDWEPDTITWYFDGQQVAQQATPADMHQPMYMLVDTIAGTSGSWQGRPNPGETASMKVDYIRAYSSDPYTNGGTPPASSSSPTPAPASTQTQTPPASSGSDTSPAPASPGTQPSSTSTPSSSVSPDQLVLALSEDAYQGDAQFIIKVDGTQLGDPQSVTASHAAGQTQNFTFSGNWGAGPHNVEVDFLNDADAGPGQDRNLYVNQVTYDGTAAVSQTLPLYSNGGVTIPVGQS